jgi:hypothetical protein
MQHTTDTKTKDAQLTVQKDAVAAYVKGLLKPE